MPDTPRILDAVTCPQDLHALTDEELTILAREIREEIVSVTSQTGGHVASSLGAVEIILAVHSLIDSPKDKFIFDVGHQAYAHKLVTGRLGAFDTLRSFGGLSGFPKPTESPHDVHPSGHASDSLSIALGLAKARDLRGTDEKIVTLIGDASIAGGMAFEALSHIGSAQTPMLIILNDNEMSIGRSVGALAKHFGAMRTSSSYRRTREELQARMEKSGPVTRWFLNWGRNAKESMKQFFVPNAMIYEQLNIVCTAPVDGHDIRALRETMEICLRMDGPVLMHVVTKKGVGYQPAMADPERFHGLGPYDIATGAAPAKKPGTPPTYTQVFGRALVEEARADGRIVALTAAMRSGTGLTAFAEEFPERFVDGGIAEEHVVGMACGLAYGGVKPVCAIYSTFLQRAFDQVVVDGALAGANVVFAIDRAGVVGEDGPTHHGVFDMAYLRMIPGMRMLAPSDEAELACALHTALTLDGPVAIRYPRGVAAGAEVPPFGERQVLEVGRSRLVFTGIGAHAPLDAHDAHDAHGHDHDHGHRDPGEFALQGSDGVPYVAILAWGRMVAPAKAAAEALVAAGMDVCLWDMRWVKPVDVQAVRAASAATLVVTVEEGSLAGGVGEAVCAEIDRLGARTRVLTLGIPDEFVTQGKPDQLLHLLGLDAEGIAAAVSRELGTI